MAALTGVRATKQLVGEPLPPRVDYPIAANVKIWQGSQVMLDAGYLKPAATATGKLVVGMAEATVDNTGGGAAGAKKVPVRPGVSRWGNSAAADLIAQAQVGLLCWAVDDQTVAKTDGGATRSVAGTIAAVDSGGVWVQQGLVSAVDGTALAAEITAREAITTDLASTANAKGASLVGIEDAAALYAGATVEAAMAEKLTGLRVANYADNAVIGGVPVVTVVAVPDAATGDVDVVLTHKTEVLDIVVIKTGAAGGVGDTITVKNGATAITDAIDINIADKVRKEAATIDDAQTVISAGGTLKVTRTKASAANAAARVVVIGVRRA
jgi:hypothetical protein